MALKIPEYQIDQPSNELARAVVQSAGSPSRKGASNLRMAKSLDSSFHIRGMGS